MKIESVRAAKALLKDLPLLAEAVELAEAAVSAEAVEARRKTARHDLEAAEAQRDRVLKDTKALSEKMEHQATLNAKPARDAVQAKIAELHEEKNRVSQELSACRREADGAQKDLSRLLERIAAVKADARKALA